MSEFRRKSRACPIFLIEERTHKPGILKRRSITQPLESLQELHHDSPHILHIIEQFLRPYEREIIDLFPHNFYNVSERSHFESGMMELLSDDLERAELYRLFSGLFIKEPDKETITQVREIFRTEFKDSSEEIRNDFASLFLRPDMHLAPYESLFVLSPGEKPGLGGKPALDVQAFYGATGLMLGETELAPDHLSVELLFMSYLVENRELDKQRLFLEGHLVRWAPGYCDAVAKHAATIFYREIANLLKQFILSEYDLIS